MPVPAFHILIVCTGNICRSPAAELLLREALAGDGRFTGASAGTHAMAGWPISPPMDELLASRGIASNLFAARQADAPMLRGADLILTATREHREWVARQAPTAVRRAFTLTEFTDAIAGVPDPSAMTARELVIWSAAHRPTGRVTSLGRSTRRGYVEGDILDPYGRGRAAYVAALAQLDPLVQRIATALLATR